MSDLGEHAIHVLRNRGAGACGGDCDRDAAVSIDELIAGIGIALQGAPVPTCPAVDVDRDDGTVVVAEIIGAVWIALSACP